jgi:hypothetical protein
MINIKPYDTLTSIEKKARNAFKYTRCNGCFYEHSCTTELYAVCISSYTKGFVRGVKYHRQVVKNKKK